MQIMKLLIMNFFQTLVNAVFTDLAKFFGAPIVDEDFDC